MNHHRFKDNDAQVAREARKNPGNPRDLLVCALRNGYTKTAAVCVDEFGVSLDHELDDGPYPVDTPFTIVLTGGPMSETKKTLAWLIERNALCDYSDVVKALQHGFLEEARWMAKKTPNYVYTWNTEFHSVYPFRFTSDDTVMNMRMLYGHEFEIGVPDTMKITVLVRKKGRIIPVKAEKNTWWNSSE